MSAAATVQSNINLFLERNKYKITATKTAATNIILECDGSAISKNEIATPAEKSSKLTVVIILNDDGVVKKSPEMEKLLDSIKGDIFVIVPIDISSSVQRKVDLIKSKRSTDYIMIHHYRNFIMDYQSRETAFPHRVLSKDEVRHLLDTELIKNIMELSLIKAYEVQAIWANARPGDIVHIRRKSETTVYEDAYRRCVAN